MWRSPIFSLLLVLIAYSCQKSRDEISITDALDKGSKDTLVAHYSEKAAIFQSASLYDSAFYYFSKSKDLALFTKDYSYAAYNLLAMAHIQQSFADYASSEETLTEALPFLEENSDNKLAALNLFGIAAKEVKNYDDALRYYNQLIPFSKDSIRQATLANNIASVYMEQNNYAYAITILKPFANGTFLDTLPQRKARIMDNLGFAYYKNGASEQGLHLLDKALLIRTQQADSYGSIISYLHLAEYHHLRNPTLAKNNAMKAYQLATKHQSVDERLDALAFLMVHNAKIGVNEFAVQYAKLNDSVTMARNKAKNQFAKIKYDSQKATLEALRLKGEKTELALKLESKQLQSYVMYLGVLILVILMVYLIHYYKVKNKEERLKTTYSTETRIAKMVHDELANDVFYTMNFAETQDLENSSKKSQLLDHLDQIYHKTRNISKENSPIATGETFFVHLKEMLSSYKSPTIEVIIRNGNAIEWSKVTDDKKIAIQRVLQELMVNMKKHSQASFVVIGFDGGVKQFQVTYADNGIGCPEATIYKNGLQNAENRIHAIKGQLTFDFSSPKGFKAKITVPN